LSIRLVVTTLPMVNLLSDRRILSYRWVEDIWLIRSHKFWLFLSADNCANNSEDRYIFQRVWLCQIGMYRNEYFYLCEIGVVPEQIERNFHWWFYTSPARQRKL